MILIKFHATLYAQQDSPRLWKTLTRFNNPEDSPYNKKDS